VIKSLAKSSPQSKGRKVEDVSLVGGSSLEWRQDERGLSVKLPDRLPSAEAIGLRIRGVS